MLRRGFSGRSPSHVNAEDSWRKLISPPSYRVYLVGSHMEYLHMSGVPPPESDVRQTSGARNIWIRCQCCLQIVTVAERQEGCLEEVTVAEHQAREACRISG